MSKNISQIPDASPWNDRQKLVFRFLLIWLLLLTIPFDGAYYRNIFSTQLTDLGFQDLWLITRHVPGIYFFSDNPVGGWLTAFIIAAIATAIWSYADQQPRNYDRLYYWSRAALRYRLALGILVYGILLIIPEQIPAPAISDLHTPYGDFLPWKLYFHSTAVASAGYRQSLGAIEIIGSLLLLCRRTTVFGAILIVFILVNIVLANFAYQIGEQWYAVYLLLLALVLLIYDFPRLYALLVKESTAIPDTYKPVFSRSARLLKNSIRGAFLVFAILFLGLTIKSNVYDNSPYPRTVGLTNASGVYNVSSFKINDTILPYSQTDSVRWQDVVFEKWNVLSVRTNKPAAINLRGPESLVRQDALHNYEFAGNGGRNFYSYQQDGNTIKLTNPNDTADKARFIVTRPDSVTVILRGSNDGGDSLWVTLNKINKKYLLYEGRRKPVSIN